MTSRINCEICSTSIEETDVQSTSSHEAVCSDCYAAMWECTDCCEHHDDDADQYETTSGTICNSCRENGEYTNCFECDTLIALNNDSYYYDEDHHGEHCCESCGENTLFECNCGREVPWYEAGHDHSRESQCQRCWNNYNTHISRSSNMNSAQKLELNSINLKDSYTAVSSTTRSFFEWFYGNMGDDFEYNSIQIKKGASGVGGQLNWHSQPITVKSEIYLTTGQMFGEMINSEFFITEHKKYGLYHPLRHLFRRALKYYDLSAREYIEGVELSMDRLGKNYFNFRVERLDPDIIAEMLADNKTEDGADLKRAVNQIMTRAYKHRFPARTAAYPQWETTLESYKTNSSNIELTLEIGYSDAIMKELVRFNTGVSCQERCNKDNYAFGLMDMVVNPHLFALIRDKEDAVIGRSVIRFWKSDWSDSSAPIYIAPSRLYLTGHTNSKKDAYIAMFTGINEWAKQTFKNERKVNGKLHAWTNYKIIAYKGSRHDSSISSYLMNSSKLKLVEPSDRNVKYFTQTWLPWWITKPENSEAQFTYYTDEDQRPQIREVADFTDNSEKYAVFEMVYADTFKIVEVTND